MWGLEDKGNEKALALAAIEATEDYFRSIAMPTCLSELLGAIQPQQVLQALTRGCTFQGKRTIGTFRVLGHEDILAIYTMANH